MHLRKDPNQCLIAADREPYPRAALREHGHIYTSCVQIALNSTGPFTAARVQKDVKDTDYDDVSAHTKERK